MINCFHIHLIPALACKVAMVFSLCILSLFMTSCKHDTFDSAFLQDETVRLTVNNKVVFKYDDLNCQMGYNSSKHEFRVHTDNMSDYYILTLSKMPTSEEETITGSIAWTDEYETVSKSNISFKVGKISDDGTIWLGSTKDKILLVVRNLD